MIHSLSHAGPSEVTISVIRDEVRKFEELLKLMQAGLLSDDQVRTRIKNIETTLRRVRYSRTELTVLDSNAA